MESTRRPSLGVAVLLGAIVVVTVVAAWPWLDAAVNRIIL